VFCLLLSRHLYVKVLLKVLVMMRQKVSLVEAVKELSELHHGSLFLKPLVIEGFEYLEIPIVKDFDQDGLFLKTFL
jgi:hypothetical protein